MTISSQQGRQAYAGDGVSTVFTVPFKFFQNSDLTVILQSASGVDTTLTENVHYTVTGAGSDGGGTVTMATAPAIGETLSILLDPELTQPVDYIANDVFPAETHERALDRLTQQNIRTRDMVARALRLPDGDANTMRFLPGAAARAGMFLRFDNNGDPEVATGIDQSQTLSQSVIGQILYPQTPAEAAAGVPVIHYFRAPGDVRRYGAVLDGVTSDHVAFQRADAQSAQGGAPIFVPRADNPMATDTTLTVDYRSDLVFEPGARVLFTDTANVPIVVIGSTDPAEIAFSRRYENLWFDRANQSDWQSEDNIGVLVHNAAACYISIAQISGCTVGFRAHPQNGAGFQGNVVVCQHIYNCKIARDLVNSTAGFCNDNTFIGGRIQCFSAVNALGDRFGDRITSLDGSYLNNNGNRFYGSLIELNGPGASGDAVAILVEHGDENFWLDVRAEGNDLAMRCENASQRNEMWLGYSDDAQATIEQLDTANQNTVIPMRVRPRTHFTYPLAQFSDLGRRARGVSGTSILIEGLTWAISSSDTTGGVSSTSVTYDGDYVTLPTTRGMGLYVDTSTVKEFVVRRSGTAGGRVGVVAYDSSNNILSGAGTVVGTDATPMSYQASLFGGSWMTGSDFLSDAYFRVSSETDHIWLFVCGGDAPAVLSSFSVYTRTPVAGVRVYTGKNTNLGQIVPAYTTGTYTPLRNFAGTSSASDALQILQTLVDDLKIAGVLR